MPSGVLEGTVMVTEPFPPLPTVLGVAAPSSVPGISVPVALFSRNRNVSPAIMLETVPVTDPPGRIRVGDVVSAGAPTVAGLLPLSAPRQFSYTGSTAHRHVPGGVAVWVHVVPFTIEEQVPLLIVCRTVPAESYRRTS